MITNFDLETPFLKLAMFIENFNKENPSKIQPISDDVLSLLNELGGVNISTHWQDAYFNKWNSYNAEYDKFPDLSTVSIKKIQLDFGTSFETFENELLLDQILRILEKNIKRQYLRTISKKRGPGQNKSSWLRTCEKGKPILTKLYEHGTSNDFLAHFFNVEPDTFKRKIRTVFLKQA